MTVSTTNNRVSYAGNSVTTVFSFPNKFLLNADLIVLSVLDSTGAETTKVLTTDYTLTGAGDAAGGNVTMLVAPATGTTLVVYRDPALTQPIDLVNGDPLNVEDGIEKGLDRAALQIQRVNEKYDRALRLPEGDTNVVAGDITLPARATRLSKYLAFDSAGALIASTAAAGAPTTPFTVTLLDDTTAPAFRTTLGSTTVGDAVFVAATSAAARTALDAPSNSEAILDTIMDAAGDLIVGTAADTVARLAIGTARQTLTVNAGATAPAWAAPITLVAEQASTSGTSIDFTGIPAGVKRITIMLAGVSTNGTSGYLVQIGDAGGIETTGYLGTCNSTGFTTGFGIVSAAAAAELNSGCVILNLQKAATFSWVESGSMSDEVNTNFPSAFRKSLSAELDRVRITTVNGTDTFDAGAISISYE